MAATLETFNVELKFLKPPVIRIVTRLAWECGSPNTTVSFYNNLPKCSKLDIRFRFAAVHQNFHVLVLTLGLIPLLPPQFAMLSFVAEWLRK